MVQNADFEVVQGSEEAQAGAKNVLEAALPEVLLEALAEAAPPLSLTAATFATNSYTPHRSCS